MVAHRGAPGYAKENTIESFEKAVALGADMIEFDIRRTKDNVLIVYHDELIEGKPVNHLGCEEIGQIARNRGFDIPTVEEVLKWSRGRIKLDVELKEEGYEKEIVELLSGFFKEDQFVITSFNESSLKIIKDSYPSIQVGLLLGKSKAPPWTRISEFFPMKRCKKAQADFLVVHFKLLRFGFLERARRSHKPVFVWTINDEGMIRKLLNDRRVYAIITDKPDLAVSLKKKWLQQDKETPGVKS
ncbi:MAG: glycerophosphodiester phosphodiesterase [Thermodesulfobacteriota bacterium]